MSDTDLITSMYQQPEKNTGVPVDVQTNKSWTMTRRVPLPTIEVPKLEYVELLEGKIDQLKIMLAKMQEEINVLRRHGRQEEIRQTGSRK